MPEDDLGLILEFKGEEMRNPMYTIIVYLYMLGQYRIQVTELGRPDVHAPPGHGSICRLLCTYDWRTLVRVVDKLRDSDKILEKVDSYRRPWNSEGPYDRVRLDNTEEDYIK